MRYPWANSLLLLFLGVELLSGFFGLVSGSEDRAIYIQTHRVAGYGILAVLVWKTVNVVVSWKWPRAGTVRTASLLLTVLLVITLVLGLAWSLAGPYHWWIFSGVSWHIYTGAAIVPLLIWHSWHMARRAPLGFWVERRQFLRIAGLALAGFVAWQATEGLARAADLSGRSRRFTGSYEAGSFTGNDFPRVSWLDDDPDRIEVAAWTLEVYGAATPAAVPVRRRLCQGRAGRGDAGLHRRVALNSRVAGNAAGGCAGCGVADRIGEECRGKVGHGVLPAVLSRRRPRVPACYSRRRGTAVPRPRRSVAPRCAGTARVRVGEVGD